MEAILDDRDSVVVLPTGGGKSLCFQAPALVRPGLALVVSPLISLMKDQVDSLTANGVPAACFNSSLPADERASVPARPARRTLPAALRVAGAAGGRAQRKLPRQPRAQRRRLHRRRRGALHQPVGPRLPSGVPAAGAAATGVSGRQPPRLHRDRDRAGARRHRRAARACATRSSWSARSTGRTWSTACSSRAQLKRQILDVLGRHRGHAGIIYCTSRREVDALAAWLSETGVRARRVSRRPERRGAQPQPGRVSRRARRRRGGDRRLRHGHRSLRRALRRPCRARRSRSSTISRSPAGPAATASKPNACWSTRRRTS